MNLVKQEFVAFLFIPFLFILSLSSWAQVRTVHDCKLFVKDKRTKLSEKSCREYVGKIGQLYIMNADDVFAKGEKILHPWYRTFFKHINPSGLILTQRNIKKNSTVIKQLTTLKKETQYPLFVGGDHCYSFYKNQSIRVHYLANKNLCQARFNAALVRASGCNFLFHPRIDLPMNQNNLKVLEKKQIDFIKESNEYFYKMGILLTLKHLPFIDESVDLHHKTTDLKISKNDLINKILYPLKSFFPHEGLVMTTHSKNSLIDSTLVTYSPVWVDFLKQNLDLSKSLIITDSLNMVENYKIEDIDKGFDYKLKDPIDILGYSAVRAILSGHDLVVTRQSLELQEVLLNKLILLAIGADQLGSDLRARIDTAFNRVVQFKEKYKKQLNFMPKISDKEHEFLAQKVIQFDQITANDCQTKQAQKIFKKLESF